MSQQSSETSRDPRRNSWLVLVLLVMIVIPAAIALNTVQFPGILQISNLNPTPFGSPHIISCSASAQGHTVSFQDPTGHNLGGVDEAGLGGFKHLGSLL